MGSSFDIGAVEADLQGPNIATVSLISPVGTISDTQPIFTWSPASDNGEIVGYTLLITDSSGVTTTVSTTGLSYTPSTDLTDGNYTWTVKAHDGVDNTSDYVGPSASFTLATPTPSTFATLHLPIVLNDYGKAPDLVIDSLMTSNDTIFLTIRNAGNETVVDAFWVDVYLNPSRPPSINEQWDAIAPSGAVWGVTQNLAPGETLTLTVGDGHYYSEHSSDTFPTNATIYALADSVNFDTTYGNVLEGDETNNLAGSVTSSVSGASAISIVSRMTSYEALPARSAVIERNVNLDYQFFLPIVVK